MPVPFSTETGALLHSAAYRRDHPHEWSTLEDLFTEACDYWRERLVPFWVFLA